MRLGIIGKTNSDIVLQVVEEISDWLEKRDIDVFLENDLGKKIGHKNSVDKKELPSLIDVILVFGGDGTFLGVAKLVCDYGIPIVGFNLGGLGFLTEITTDEMYDMLERIIKGEYEIEKRNLLESRVYRNGIEVAGDLVVNEIAINKGALSRILDLALYIDEKYVTTFKADGIILSTPTGSTAYSLSAGGPIVYPTLPVTLITPICPHILTNRPLIVSNSIEIMIEVLTDTTQTYLRLDGQLGIKIQKGDFIKLNKYKKTFNMIRSPYRDYFTILKTKLMWGQRYGSVS